MLRAIPRTPAPLSPGGAEILRLVTEQRAPVFLTVHPNGRRRYGYWQAVGSEAGRGGCHVALPTAECDALHAAGRIELGDPVIDPGKTTYPVRVAIRPAPSLAGSRRQAVTGSPRQAVTGAARLAPVDSPRQALTA
ncbi:hypothetical protein ACIP79_39360 [Streptomyces sp. NPDC088747]|uniref:hypothetical protein n=1 Tax=Streptomyces sp. NPDC088747 TaxID=3365886 RepID=UPI00380F5C1A